MDVCDSDTTYFCSELNSFFFMKKNCFWFNEKWRQSEKRFVFKFCNPQQLSYDLEKNPLTWLGPLLVSTANLAISKLCCADKLLKPQIIIPPGIPLLLNPFCTANILSLLVKPLSQCNLKTKNTLNTLFVQ